jgi:hypothetical protein
MPLTTDQLQALKADIAANTATVIYAGQPVAINAVPNDTDANFAVADWYNQTASPAWRVWRTDVPVKDVKKAVVWTEYIASVSQADHNAFTLMISNGIVNAADVNVRQGIADIFNNPNKTTTRNNLLAISKRDATRAEKLFSTGTGTTASPATMGYERPLTYQDVQTARNLA